MDKAKYICKEIYIHLDMKLDDYTSTLYLWTTLVSILGLKLNQNTTYMNITNNLPYIFVHTSLLGKQYIRHGKLLKILYTFELFIKRRFEHCLVMCTTCSSKYFIYINDLLSITLPKAISNTEESLQYCERFLYISFGVYINNSPFSI